MPYAEVITEPGSHSVISYETEDELKSFLTEVTRRAQAGEQGGPAGNPAERVTKVYTYSEHPADLHPVGVSAESAAALIDGMKDSTTENVDTDQLIAALRDESSPVYPIDQGRHESMYKADGEEFDLAFLSASAAPDDSGGE